VATVESAPSGYRVIFANREFRAVFTAHTISMAGDQLARVALSVLVFERTASAALTALAYALTFLPDLIGGPLLSGIADRAPRRTVLVAADVARAVLVATMAIPGAPLLVVCALLFVVQLLSSPANAARTATVRVVLAPDAAAVTQGIGAMQAVGQAALVLGFGLSGALVAATGVSVTLLVDAATFVVSGLLIGLLVRTRPAPARSGGGIWWSHLPAVVRLVWTDRQLRAILAMVAVTGAFIAGEAVAVPYAAELGGGAVAVSLIFVAYATGCAIVSVLVARLAIATQHRALPLLVIGACAPLVCCALNPPLPVVLAIFVLSGASSAFHVIAQSSYVRRVPDEQAGQAIGLAVTVLKVAQGLGIVIAGLAAEVAPPHAVVAGAGVIGVIAALGAAGMWRTASRPAA